MASVAKKELNNFLKISFFIEVQDTIIGKKVHYEDFLQKFNNLSYDEILIGELSKSKEINSEKINYDNGKSFYILKNSDNTKNGKTYIPVIVKFDLKKYNPKATNIPINQLKEEDIFKINKKFYLDFLYKTNRGEVFNFDKKTFFKYCKKLNTIDMLGDNLEKTINKISEFIDGDFRIYVMGISF